jgi:hypothetical protein
MRYINLIIVFVYVSFLCACGHNLNPPKYEPYLNKTYRFTYDHFICESSDHTFSFVTFSDYANCGSISVTKAEYYKNPSYYSQWHYNGLFMQNRISGIVKKNTRFKSLAIYEAQDMSDGTNYVVIEILDGAFAGLKGDTRMDAINAN